MKQAALGERDLEHSNSMRLLENGFRQQLQVGWRQLCLIKQTCGLVQAPAAVEREPQLSTLCPASRLGFSAMR